VFPLLPLAQPREVASAPVNTGPFGEIIANGIARKADRRRNHDDALSDNMAGRVDALGAPVGILPIDRLDG